MLPGKKRPVWAAAFLAIAGPLLSVACGYDPYKCPSGGYLCKSYIACYEATGGARGALDVTFGASGTCWSTTLQAACDCGRQCYAGLKLLRTAYPDAGCDSVN